MARQTYLVVALKRSTTVECDSRLRFSERHRVMSISVGIHENREISGMVECAKACILWQFAWAQISTRTWCCFIIGERSRHEQSGKKGKLSLSEHYFSYRQVLLVMCHLFKTQVAQNDSRLGFIALLVKRSVSNKRETPHVELIS